MASAALACALCVATGARAQSATTLGPGATALPGYHRVRVAAIAPRGVLVAAGMGYGVTESQTYAPGGHHRLGARISGSLTPLPGLDVAVESRVRHDRHESDALGPDQGTVVDSDVHGQLGTRLGGGFHVGMGVGATLVRGEDVGGSLQNPAVSLTGLAAYVPIDHAFSFGLNGGFRHDQTARAVRPPATYRAGDRLALGLSAFDAVELGVGGAYRLGATELVAELSGDVLVGSGAPPLEQSPLRAAVGGRHALSEAFALQLMTETALGSRPPTGADDPLAPIEPRFQVLVGVAYRLLDWDAPARHHTEPEALPTPTRSLEPAAECALQVNVMTADGYPLSDATVELEQGGRVMPVPHRDLASYARSEIPCRESVLRVRAARLTALTQTIALDRSAPVVVDVQLQPALQTGQLRGLVRSFSGERIQARVRVEPVGIALDTDAAGTFSAEVPPGRYEIVIEARGHQRQRRRVEVKADGVVILNADLTKANP